MDEETLKPLQFVSNVIELKPDKKYLLVFKNVNIYQLNAVDKALRERGFDCLSIVTYGDQELSVIEAPSKLDSSKFWEELVRAMAINERREIFKKLGEHLGIDVSEWGEVDDGVKKHYSVEEARKILEPYMEIPID